MRQIISLEKQFMTIPFPASGSLYYRRDLEASQATIPLPGQSSLPPFDQVVVGPTAQYEGGIGSELCLMLTAGHVCLFSTAKHLYIY